MIDLGIVVTPGNGFGESANGYIRVAVTKDTAQIEEALKRMKNNI